MLLDSSIHRWYRSFKLQQLCEKNKQVGQDWENLANYLNANKTCQNISKTDLALFKS